MRKKLINSQVTLPIEVRQSLLEIKNAYGKLYGNKSKRAYNGQGRKPTHGHKFTIVIKVLPNINDMLDKWQESIDLLDPATVADGCVSINQEIIPTILKAIDYEPSRRLTKPIKLSIMLVSAIESNEDFNSPSNLLHLKTFLNLLNNYNESGKEANANIETIAAYLLWRVAIDCRLNKAN